MSVVVLVLVVVVAALCQVFVMMAAGVPEPRVVRTEQGELRGLVVQLPAKGLGPVEQFLGVPYASPPVGTLRFMPPVTTSRWSSVRSAETLAPVCHQLMPDVSNETDALKTMPRARYEHIKRLQQALRNQSEDCLYMNLYMPAKASWEGVHLPVMVYIHGESYDWNSGNSYDGSVLASFGDVIVITLNYRLGVFGFLKIDSDRHRGNYGLFDQTAALVWIKQNIRAFGGDPSNVTVFGHDYGAACINFLMMAPVTKGLFQRVIMMSGSAFAPWAVVKDHLKYMRDLATALNCPGNHKDLVNCMTTTSVEDILANIGPVPEHLTAFGPTVDGVFIKTEPAKWMEFNSDSEQRNDLMVGVTSTEGVFPFSNEEFVSGVGPEKKARILRTLVRNIYSFHMNEIYSVLNNEYTDWTKPMQYPVNIRDATMELMGDAQFVAPVVRAADLHSAAYMNSYFYVFEYQRRNEDQQPQRLGCLHGEELPYVFGAPLVDTMFTQSNYTSHERTIAEAVMRYWTNFAKTGNPNGLERPSKPKNRFHKVEWPQYETVHQKYLAISKSPKIKHHYRSHKMSVWLKLVPDIHGSGTSSVTLDHHLINNHDDPSSFEGIVKPLPTSSNPTVTSIASLSTPPTPYPSLVPAYGGGTYVSPGPDIPVPKPSSQPSPTGDAPAVEASKTFSTRANVNGTNPQKAEVVHQSAYSTALSVTIAVGCSLLILNVLIFAGVYYQRDKNRIQAKLNERGQIHQGHKEGGGGGGVEDPQTLHLSGLGLGMNIGMDRGMSMGMCMGLRPPLPPDAIQMQKPPPLPPRTPPPSPIHKTRIHDYPDIQANAISISGGPALNIPRPMVGKQVTGQGQSQAVQGPCPESNPVAPESQPLLLQNLPPRSQQQRKGNMQEVRV